MKVLSFGVLARSANQLSKYQINRIPNIWRDAKQGGSEVKENQSAKICVKMGSVTDDNLTVQLSWIFISIDIWIKVLKHLFKFML